MAADFDCSQHTKHQQPLYFYLLLLLALSFSLSLSLLLLLCTLAREMLQAELKQSKTSRNRDRERDTLLNFSGMIRITHIKICLGAISTSKIPSSVLGQQKASSYLSISCTQPHTHSPYIPILPLHCLKLQ